MDLINCQECGKVFASGGEKICSDCKKSEEEKFEIVKNYLWENPNSTVEAVSKATEVEKKLIIKFIRENRLRAAGIEIDYTLKCKRCSEEIEAGVYCDSCRKKLLNDLNSDSSEENVEGKKEAKMFLSDRFKRKE